MRVEPFGDRVAIKVVQPEEKTAGGLIMATAKANSNRGEILALGEEAKDYFKVGDTVIFLQGSGVNYTNGSEDYKILNSKDILCRIIEE